MGAAPSGLAELRLLVALAVLLASPVYFLWMLLSPRLPKSIFLAPVLFLAWWAFGGFPVQLFADSPAEHAAIGSTLQVLLAAVMLLVVRRRTGGRWLLQAEDFTGPNFRLLTTLGFALVTLVVGVPLLFVQLLASTATAIEARTNGFIDFQRDGVSMTERVYSKDDREIRLVGMMHIGAGDAYRDLYESFDRESTVLLQEGVTDREGRLAEGLDYTPLAEALGLDVQLDPSEVLGLDDAEDPDAERWPHIRHADVDLAEFSQESIDFLDATAAMITRDDLAAALREFQAFVDNADPNTWVLIEEDVLTKRNAVLLGALDESLSTYRNIVVPWGALHLPEVEAAVLARGFKPGATKQHLLFRYASILTALASFAGTETGATGGESEPAAAEFDAAEPNAAAAESPAP